MQHQMMYLISLKKLSSMMICYQGRKIAEWYLAFVYCIKKKD